MDNDVRRMRWTRRNDVGLDAALYVIDLPPGRLANWIENGVVQPRVRWGRSASDDGGRGFPFEELVIGRLARHLEDDCHLVPRDVRRIAEAVRRWDGPQSLTSITWSIGPDGAGVRYADGTWFNRSPVTDPITSGTVGMDRIRLEVLARMSRPPSQWGHTRVRRTNEGRHEYFEGTDVKVEVVARYLVGGFDDRRILAALPTLHVEDIEAVRHRARTGPHAEARPK